jgi:hypothetical protein
MHFPKKKNISHCYVGLLINHAKDIIASFFFLVKEISLIKGGKNQTMPKICGGKDDHCCI